MPRPGRRGDHRHTRAYRKQREIMFKIYGTTCHLCGHGGADTADHLVPVSLSAHRSLPVTYHSLRPAHGVKGCTTCGVKCNQARGNSTRMQRLRTSEDWGSEVPRQMRRSREW